MLKSLKAVGVFSCLYFDVDTVFENGKPSSLTHLVRATAHSGCLV